jgi:hypothetical protein
MESARAHYDEALAAAPRVAAMRYRAGLGALAVDPEADLSAALGAREKLVGAHAGWLALDSLRSRRAGKPEDAALASHMALGMDPWSELVACEGESAELRGASPVRLTEPVDPDRRRLCEGARARPPVR